jgi:valyl-tRNA synthetase
LLGLGLALWEGVYEGLSAVWLRWCDEQGDLIMTGYEASLKAQQQAEAERQRAEAERQRAEAERQRAEKLAAQLRALGIEPDDR